MKSIRLIIVTCLSTLFASCSPVGGSFPNTTITAPSVKATSVSTVAPTATITSHSPSSTATFDSILTQDVITGDCNTLSDEDVSDQVDGILLLRYQNNFRLLDIRNATVSNLLEQEGNVRARLVSPDNRYLLVEVCSNGCKYILKNSTQVLDTIPVRSDWVLWQWLDNERVVILSRIEPHDVTILNPFTGDVEEFSIDLPNPYSLSQTPEESVIPISLNPSLNKVLFYDEQFGGRLILWSIDEEREIVSVPYNVDRSVGFGSWSPDGQKYITSSPDNRTTTMNALFSIDRNGILTRLTNFDQNYEFANVTNPVWNPDNQHIAFWLKIGSESSSKPEDLPQFLTIMNVSSLETKVLCQMYSISDYPAFPVIWSPNGQQLIANTRTDEGIVEPVLIDIAHLTRTKVSTQGNWVEGWLAP